MPALEAIDRLIPDTPEGRLLDDEIDVDMDIAQLVYDARVESKLTQAELAKRIGTTQSVISRLEDSNYRGHSLKMLVRIAHALDKRVVLKLVRKPEPKTAVAARRRKR